MGDHLILGNRCYSSWSLRVWLLVRRFELPIEVSFVDFDDGAVADLIQGSAPARTVPVLHLADGPAISESLAIAEEFASRFPEAGLWPADPNARAVARALSAEMACGFNALRSECPMNLRDAYSGFTPSGSVRADLARLEDLWSSARVRTPGAGPWLCGPYCIADAFYAPVAARIATYDLPVGPVSAAYVRAHLEDPTFRACRAEGMEREGSLARYTADLPPRPWPGPPDESRPSAS